MLIEIPEVLIPGLEDFHVVHSSKMDKALNTIILARKTMFEAPERIEFMDKSGQPNPRIIGCNLVSKPNPRIIGCKPRVWQTHVIGVHMSGKGHEKEFVAQQLEEAIRPDTILAGDFNTDLRRKAVFQDLAMQPKLAKLLEQPTKLPLSVGTSNKQRSAFQAQISKIRTPDFSMKDFIMVGEAFEVQKSTAGSTAYVASQMISAHRTILTWWRGSVNECLLACSVELIINISIVERCQEPIHN